MFPPDFAGQDRFRHTDLHKILEEPRPLPRGRSADTPEPFVSFHPMGQAQPPRATLIDLARDPRFAERRTIVERPGLRVVLGRGLMALGWWLVRS